MRLLVLLLLLLGACHAQAPDTPVAGYLAFLSAVHQGDEAAAYAMLSEGTRKKLDERARELSTASGGALQNNAADWVFSPSQPTATPSEVREVHREGNTATLEVAEDGGVAAVRMVREGAGWKLDLSAEVK